MRLTGARPPGKMENGDNMIDLVLQNHRPLRELVYEELKKKILVGEITPGTRMMEVELAEEMGVSRTPIREAIRKLEKEGLVTIEPRRGAYASEISVSDIVDVLVVRENLEGLAASLTALKITEEELEELERITTGYDEAVKNNDTSEMILLDEQFHKDIVSFSGNKTLIKLSETVQDLTLRFRYLYYDDFKRYENMPSEHRHIIDAIRSGDSEQAKIAADNHVKKLKEFVMEEGESSFK